MPKIRILYEAMVGRLAAPVTPQGWTPERESLRTLDRESLLGPSTAVLTRFFTLHSSSRFALVSCLAWPLLAAGCGGTNWIKNGLLDPTQVGQFTERRRNEIRRTLSILEEPGGIPGAVEPTAEDLLPDFEEPPIGPGDALVVSIYELQLPGLKSEQQIHVGHSGFETIQVLGPVRVVGFTPRELELEFKLQLREAGILDDADVQVSVLQSQAKRFSIIGSVARAGIYPLPGSEYRLFSAIAAAGGIPATIETIHVFRKVDRKASSPDLTDRRRSPETTSGGGSPIRYTMSEVSTGSAGVGEHRRHAGRGEQGLLQDVEAPEDGPGIEPEWDAQRGEWVLRAPQTQPESAPEHHPASSTAPSAGEPMSRQVPDEAEERPDGEADAPWEEGEQLGPPMRIIEIPVKELMEGDPRYNIVIRSNDLIRVAPGAVGEFFMMGNIARPGAYSLTGRRLTVKEAIASAGGFGPLAWPSRADLVRRVGPDEEEIIQLDLDAIFAGEAPDFYVKPSDIINVGTSPASVFFAVLRNAFRLTYGMGFVYDRNFADSDTFSAREQVKQRRNFESQQRGIPL